MKKMVKRIISYVLLYVLKHWHSRSCKLSLDEAWNQIKHQQYKYKEFSISKDRTQIASNSSIDASFIVPVYNIEKYIGECIDSILEQETTYTYEIICVDDGSTDKSGLILDEYASKYPNIIIIHQNNLGPSAARNAAIDIAVGQYICFVDGDDYISSNYLQLLLGYAHQYDVECVKCKCISVDVSLARKDAPQDMRKGVVKKYIDKEKSIDFFEQSGFTAVGCWKRKLFEKLRFPEGYIWEDMITKGILYQMISGYVLLDNGIYFYRRNRKDSITGTKRKKGDPHILDQLYLPMEIKKVCDVLQINNSYLRYRIWIRELGVLIYGRIKPIGNKAMRAAFIIASSFLRENSPEEYRVQFKDKSDSEYWIQESMWGNDYVMWRLAILLKKVS